LILGAIFILGIFFIKPALTEISKALVYKDFLKKSEAIIILSGGNGHRIQTAARLYHEGFGEKLVFSGFKVYPETYTNMLMKSYAVKLGVPENKIISKISEGEVSTQGESISNLKLLKQNNIHNFILVTSAIHTRRAHLIYKRKVSLMDMDIEFSVYPAEDPNVPIQGWWKVRTAQKSIFIEYVKSLAYYLPNPFASQTP